MKKIIALCMCLVMIVLSLTACGDSGATNLDSDKSRSRITLKCAIIVDDKTTDTGVTAMQKAFNEKIDPDAIKVEFVYYTKDEYKAQMNATMTGIANGTIQNEGDTTTGANQYPAVQNRQFDLVLITGEDMYDEYVANGWIQPLNTHLKNTYSAINEKILSEAMTVIQAKNASGECYAIPTRDVMGEYTYLAIKKDVLNACNINESKIVDLSSAYTLIKQLMESPDQLSQWTSATCPLILNTEEEFNYPTVKYLSQNGEFSLIGVKYNSDSTAYDTAFNTTLNLLTDKSYTDFLEMKWVAKQNNYFGNGDNEDYVMGIVKGDYGMRNNPDYYYCVLEMPRLTNEDIFDCMIAVSSFTVSVPRSMEIIQKLMVNETKGLLNTLLYGVDNYELSSDSVVKFRASSEYGLHPDYLIGNLQEMAYPCADYGQNADTYKNAQYQIADLEKTIFDNTFYNSFSDIHVDAWTSLDQRSTAYYNDLMSSTTRDLFRSKLDSIITETTNDKPLDSESTEEKSFHFEYHTSLNYGSSLATAFRKFIQTKK